MGGNDPDVALKDAERREFNNNRSQELERERWFDDDSTDERRDTDGRAKTKEIRRVQDNIEDMMSIKLVSFFNIYVVFASH